MTAGCGRPSRNWNAGNYSAPRWFTEKTSPVFPARGGRVRVGGGVAGAPADVRARQAGDVRQEAVAQREVVGGDSATRRTKVVREDNVRQLADGRLEAVASRLSLT